MHEANAHQSTPNPLPAPLAGGFNLAGLPPDTLLDDTQAALALGLKPSTLGIWRCTGRYALPYLKIGRLVRYRAGDLATWLAGRVCILASRTRPP